jgi:signal transduction histidine kinase
MTIKFKARVLLELGAELISSDAVAIYELVKNGIDAGSPQIEVDINVAIQPSAVRRVLSDWFGARRAWSADAFLNDVRERLEATASDDTKKAFLAAIGRPPNAEAAAAALQEAVFDFNEIIIKDLGKGMTRQSLVDCYLTVGTPGRLHEKKALLASQTTSSSQAEKMPLGEKGIGRLAAMRLGHYVEVYTGVVGEEHWHVLELDWRPVFDLPDLDADQLQFQPTEGAQKTLKDKGTDIIIRDLQTDWSVEKIQALWSTDLAKLADPFGDQYASRFLKVSFQGDRQRPANPFDPDLLKHADAYCKITYTFGSDAQPKLHVQVEYRRFGAAVAAEYSGPHLESAVSNPPKKGRAKAGDRLPGSDEVVAALATLGGFEAEFYWFNRGRIMRDDQPLWSTLGPFVSAWSGGLLVYRDGFRVYPYGSGSEDWLDLDRKALASSAFKLNRAQIVGRLSVSSRANPRLKDQTNREGFRDCPEKEALRRLLRRAIVVDCRTFLESAEKKEKILDPNAVSALDKKIEASSNAATRTLLNIQKRLPEEGEHVQQVLAELTEVQDAWKRAKDALRAKGDEIKQYVHLAGVGLSVEFIAHELARSTELALELLKDKNINKDPTKLDSLRAQLKTINKRVRVIDELSIPGRQRKTQENLKELADLISEVYEEKASRHGVKVGVREFGKATTIRVERGQVLQILDNLMSNAMYWLNHRVNRSVAPSIDINIDHGARLLTFTDSGPGVPTSIATRIFEAFYTTKPDGDGRGLGLAIARQLAKENNATLEVLPPEGGVHHGFALTFKG